MALYRLYLVEQDERIRRAPVQLECDSDAEALEAVREHDQRFAMELWQGTRLVKCWPNRR